MKNKGFTDNHTNIETPSDVVITEKPLKTHLKASNRVDINVLKSKLQEVESKENNDSRILEHLILSEFVIYPIHNPNPNDYQYDI